MLMTTDESFMQRTLELAQLGIGYVSPNPRVGCVIVNENKIIGEGWHQKFGGAHAEVNAINSVANQSLLKESTVYVNLEPCSHFGKTPPCADLLVRHQLKKVVIGNLDTNPLVAGQGVKKLTQAGIEVTVGVLAKASRELNKNFFSFIEKERPYIILKWAQTLDGFIAQKNFESKWISNEFSRQLVHRWRSEEDAVLVGTHTASHDNPSLTVRDWVGRNPTRIIIDRFLRLNDHLHLFNKKEKTICYNLLKHEEHKNLLLVRIDEDNFLQALVHDLFKRNIQSVIVEGGAQTLKLFIDANLWDEACVFTSPRSFGDGIAAPAFKGKRIARQNIDSDQIDIFHPL
jgi:diaminohydroxyphosphoribosylaminopyrimidine deaminase/5-amino-6-(5-phosphoribosylamino)uracil reductase